MTMKDGALAHCAKCTEKLMTYAHVGISPDQSGSQSNTACKNSNRKLAETLENHIQSRVEMYHIKGLKQHHSRVPLSLYKSMPKHTQVVVDAKHGHT